MARSSANSTLELIFLNDLGNLYSLQRRPEAAFRAYDRSSRLAAARGDPTMAATALTNAATTAIRAGSLREAASLLERAALAKRRHA